MQRRNQDVGAMKLKKESFTLKIMEAQKRIEIRLMRLKCRVRLAQNAQSLNSMPVRLTQKHENFNSGDNY